MSNGHFNVPFPYNEPVLDYGPGSPERQALTIELDRMARKTIEIPARIGGRKVRTGRTAKAVMPHDHKHVLGKWHKCAKKEVGRAIDAAPLLVSWPPPARVRRHLRHVAACPPAGRRHDRGPEPGTRRRSGSTG